MKKRASITASLVALGLVVAPGVLGAQDASPFSVDARGGVAIPMPAMANVAGFGPAVGASASYRVHPRVHATIAGELDILSGLDADGDAAATPDVELWRALAGANVRVLEAGSPVDVSAHVLGGVTSYNTAVFPEVVFGPDGPVGDFAETYPTVAGGLEAAYPVFRSMDLSGDLYVRGAWTTMLTDEAETAIFGELRPGAGGFDRGATIPVTLGLELGF